MGESVERVKQNIRDNFKRMDTSGDGSLDKLEFVKCLQTVFTDMSTQQLYDMFCEVDRKASLARGDKPDGKITLDEMIFFALELKNPRDLKQADIRALFKKYDKDGNGNLDLQEFLQMSRDAHFSLDDKHFEKCKDARGKITADSFLKLFPDCQ